jgi:hypothetical protein
MAKKSIGYSFLCGALTFFVVLLLLIQVFGVPFWWVFGVGNTQEGWWIISVSPENPRVGENVTVGVAAGNFNIFLVENATVTITRNGMHPLTVYTDKSGEATFPYPGDGTVIRASNWWGNSFHNATEQANHSLYVAIPKTPITWVRNCLIAISGAAALGFVVGISTFTFRKTEPKLRFLRQQTGFPNQLIIEFSNVKS